MASKIEIFVCYAHEDKDVLEELRQHLGVLNRQGFFNNTWYDGAIGPGTEWVQEIDKHLNTAQIILLLINQYFINSDYCYFIEMKRAIERHEQREAWVIPIIVRHVHFEGTPIAKLQYLPKNGIPIIDSRWHSRDEAVFDVAEGIREAIEELLGNAKLTTKQWR